MKNWPCHVYQKPNDHPNMRSHTLDRVRRCNIDPVVALTSIQIAMLKLNTLLSPHRTPITVLKMKPNRKRECADSILLPPILALCGRM